MQKQAEDDRQKLPEVLRRIAVGEAFTEKADAAKDRLASLLQTQTILSEQLAALKTRSDAAKAEAQCKKLWGAAEDAARTARLTVVGQDKLLSAAEAKWNQNSAAAARHRARGRHALPRLRRGAPPRARRAVRR